MRVFERVSTCLSFTGEDKLRGRRGLQGEEHDSKKHEQTTEEQQV